MKTKVTFKAISYGKLVRKTIAIEHPEFDVIPSDIFLGFKTSPISIESQVIDYLDSIDKSDIMHKYEFDIILDYYVPKKYRKRNEISEFIEYLRPYVSPDLYRPIEAIISESKDILFGKGKSNKTKAYEVMNMLSISNKVIKGTLDMITNMINDENNADQKTLKP